MGLIGILLNKWAVLGMGIVFMLIGLNAPWTMWVVKTIGKMGWAERRLGQGGTFDMWKLIGVLAPIVALIYFFSGGVQFNNSKEDNSNSTYYQDSYRY